ncbi:uncharacterized protein GGS25DRAFT_490362 [Hypoxylon fragiforme]|uniref:uncharacterized protein n=1 Tax=Hypoxylon fragiforme TaxID=63214 RepID=UPI0020C5C1A7|nr:uncharacterized protein GGS25DRAFT_490362 [Hypoxylon fragiforme]KAI2608447.1 hypothetical protein GGS25DRAFT_490362 [Hypoxylon fragiforme]
MKCSTTVLVSAFGFCLGKGVMANAITVDPDVASPMPPPILGKRDAFTCYGVTNTSVADCQTAIDSIQAESQQGIKLYSNICAVWEKGTCKIRFCAQPYVTKPVNRTGAWLATYITTPLLDSCISQGKMGVLGDHPNINSHAGTYRLWVS